MKNRSIVLALCIAVLAIGLSLFALLRANSTATISALPTATAATREAAQASPTYSLTAPTATAWADGWSTFAGRYFTMQVAPFWKDVSDQVPASWNNGQFSTVMEDTAWRIDGVNGAYIQVQALYQPYSDLLTATDYTPFQAGDLKGETRTDSGTATVEIVLPGAPDNSAAISFKASLVMPTTLPQDIQDTLSRQFKEAVALLAPSQEARQGTPTAIPAPSGVQACSATNLSAEVDVQGCTGFYCGGIILTNTGKTPCSVGGRPIMKYVSHDGKNLQVAQSDQVPPSGNADSAVVLKSGGRAWAHLRYDSEYCSVQDQIPVTASWIMELSGVVGPITLMNETTFDICSDNLPFVADMEVGTFELEK